MGFEGGQGRAWRIFVRSSMAGCASVKEQLLLRKISLYTSVWRFIKPSLNAISWLLTVILLWLPVADLPNFSGDVVLSIDKK